MVGSQQKAGTVTAEEVPCPPAECAKMGFIMIFAYVHTIMVLLYPPIASSYASNSFVNTPLPPEERNPSGPFSVWDVLGAKSHRCAGSLGLSVP